MSVVLSSITLPLDMPTLHTFLQVIGVLGSFTYVSVFFLVQTGRLCGNGVIYPCCQLAAAICVAISLSTAFNLAAFLVQVSFIAISAYGIFYRVSGRIASRLPRVAVSGVIVSGDNQSHAPSPPPLARPLIARPRSKAVRDVDATTHRAA